MVSVASSEGPGGRKPPGHKPIGGTGGGDSSANGSHGKKKYSKSDYAAMRAAQSGADAVNGRHDDPRHGGRKPP